MKIRDSVKNLKQLQNLRLYGLVAVMSLVIIALVIMVVKGPSSANTPKRAASYKAPITSGVGRLDPKEVWAEKFTTDHEMQAKRLDAMEKMLQTLIKINEQQVIPAANARGTNDNYLQNLNPKQLHPLTIQSTGLQSANAKPPTPATAFESIDDLRGNLKDQELQASKEPFRAVGRQGQANNHHLQNSAIDANPPISPTPRFRSKGIQRTNLMLSNSKSNKNLKTFDNTIPAGTFAGAVMVGGVDASTSIQASNDPRPVLLRVTDHGTLPRKFKSDLCGCHVLAACYGDISSERVYMRLEKLTCTERKTGEVVEMTVNGYVAGEDGRAGLRGVVVDRAGESMRNAAVGGFLSGMGNFLSQSHSPITFSPMNGLAQTNPMTNPEMLKSGAAKGASNALEKYAEFYIKRAEQMQPVIQVQAGRKVDIVFTQGVAFENSAARGEMIRVNDQQRLSQLHNSNDTQTKPAEAWVSNQKEGQN